MTLHTLVEQLRTAGLDVPAYHSDDKEWRIEIDVGEGYATPYTMGNGCPPIERALGLVRDAGLTPSAVRQDCATQAWEIVLPAVP